MSNSRSSTPGDKKPFTYLPGGIDFTQLKSPKMAKRIAKLQASTPPTVPAPSSSSPKIMETPSPIRNQRSDSLGNESNGPFGTINSPFCGVKHTMKEPKLRRSISDMMASSNYSSSTLPAAPKSMEHQIFSYNPYAPNRSISIPPPTPPPIIPNHSIDQTPNTCRSNSLPPLETPPLPMRQASNKPPHSGHPPQPPRQGLPPPHPGGSQATSTNPVQIIKHDQRQEINEPVELSIMSTIISQPYAENTNNHKNINMNANYPNKNPYLSAIPTDQHFSYMSNDQRQNVPFLPTANNSCIPKHDSSSQYMSTYSHPCNNSSNTSQSHTEIQSIQHHPIDFSQASPCTVSSESIQNVISTIQNYPEITVNQPHPTIEFQTQFNTSPSQIIQSAISTSQSYPVMTSNQTCPDIESLASPNTPSSQSFKNDRSISQSYPIIVSSQSYPNNGFQTAPNFEFKASPTIDPLKEISNNGMTSKQPYQNLIYPTFSNKNGQSYPITASQQYDKPTSHNPSLASIQTQYHTQISIDSLPLPPVTSTNNVHSNLPLPLPPPPSISESGIFIPPPPPPPPPPANLGLVAQYGKSGIPYIGPKPVKSSISLASIRAGNTNIQEKGEKAKQAALLEQKKLQQHHQLQQQKYLEKQNQLRQQLEEQRQIELEKQQKLEKQQEVEQLKEQQLQQQNQLEEQKLIKQQKMEQLEQEGLMEKQNQMQLEQEQQLQYKKQLKEQQISELQLKQEKELELELELQKWKEQQIQEQKQLEQKQKVSQQKRLEHQKQLEHQQKMEIQQELYEQPILGQQNQQDHEQPLQQQQHVKQEKEEELHQEIQQFRNQNQLSPPHQIEYQKQQQMKQQQQLKQNEEQNYKQIINPNIKHQEIQSQHTEETQIPIIYKTPTISNITNGFDDSLNEFEAQRSLMLTQPIEPINIISQSSDAKEILLMNKEKPSEEIRKGEEHNSGEGKQEESNILMSVSAQKLTEKNALKQQPQIDSVTLTGDTNIVKYNTRDHLVQNKVHKHTNNTSPPKEYLRNNIKDKKSKTPNDDIFLPKGSLQQRAASHTPPPIPPQPSVVTMWCKKCSEKVVNKMHHQCLPKRTEQKILPKSINKITNTESSGNISPISSINTNISNHPLNTHPLVSTKNTATALIASMDTIPIHNITNPMLEKSSSSKESTSTGMLPPHISSSATLPPHIKSKKDSRKKINLDLLSSLRSFDDDSELIEINRLPPKEENISDPHIHGSVRLRPPSPRVIAPIQFSKEGQKPPLKRCLKNYPESIKSKDTSIFTNQDYLQGQSQHLLQNQLQSNSKSYANEDNDYGSLSNTSSFDSADMQINTYGKLDIVNGTDSTEGEDESAGKIITGKMKKIEAQMKRILEASDSAASVNTNMESESDSKRNSLRSDSADPIFSEVSGYATCSEDELKTDDSILELSIKMAPYEVMEDFEDAPEEFYLGISAYNIEHPIEKDDKTPVPDKHNNIQIYELHQPFESEHILETPRSHSPVDNKMPKGFLNRHSQETDKWKSIPNSENATIFSTQQLNQSKTPSTSHQPFENRNTFIDPFATLPSLFPQQPFTTQLSVGLFDPSFPNVFQSPFSIMMPSINFEAAHQQNQQKYLGDKEQNMVEKPDKIGERIIPIQVIKSSSESASLNMDKSHQGKIFSTIDCTNKKSSSARVVPIKVVNFSSKESSKLEDHYSVDNSAFSSQPTSSNASISQPPMKYHSFFQSAPQSDVVSYNQNNNSIQSEKSGTRDVLTNQPQEIEQVVTIPPLNATHVSPSPGFQFQTSSCQPSNTQQKVLSSPLTTKQSVPTPSPPPPLPQQRTGPPILRQTISTSSPNSLIASSQTRRQSVPTPPLNPSRHQVSTPPPTPTMLQNQIAQMQKRKDLQKEEVAQEHSSPQGQQTFNTSLHLLQQTSVSSPIDFLSSKTDIDYQKSARNAVVGELASLSGVQASKIGGGRKGPSQSPSMKLLGMLHVHDDPNEPITESRATSKEYTGNEGRFMPPKRDQESL